MEAVVLGRQKINNFIVINELDFSLTSTKRNQVRVFLEKMIIQE